MSSTESPPPERPRLQRAGRLVARLVTLGIVAWLGWTLTEIGWVAVLEALPRTPWYYLLFVVIYFSLPVCETWIYRLIWPIGFREGLRAFVAKRVLNEEVLGYSGEVYLWLWARDHVGVSRMEAFRAVRDVSIVSTIASTTVAFGLLGALVFSGQVALEELVGDVDAVLVATGVVIAVAVAAAAARFRRHLFATPPRTAGAIFGIHMLRLLGANGLILVQWAIVVPEVGWGVWFTYLAALIVLNRVPFLPSKDLFFLSLGVGMSGALGVAEASVAGLFLAASVLTRVSNLALLAATQHGNLRGGAPASPPPEDHANRP